MYFNQPTSQQSAGLGRMPNQLLFFTLTVRIRLICNSPGMVLGYTNKQKLRTFFHEHYKKNAWILQKIKLRIANMPLFLVNDFKTYSTIHPRQSITEHMYMKYMNIFFFVQPKPKKTASISIHKRNYFLPINIEGLKIHTYSL